MGIDAHRVSVKGINEHWRNQRANQHDLRGKGLPRLLVWVVQEPLNEGASWEVRGIHSEHYSPFYRLRSLFKARLFPLVEFCLHFHLDALRSGIGSSSNSVGHAANWLALITT
ncbi:hypothetical protein D3C86_1788980 [compost metagenome]